MPSALVSLVIATYRRPAMLRDTIESLTSMRIPAGTELEVILVDNDPDGGVRGTLRDLERLSAGHFTLRYVHETKTGLSYARNRGIEESRGAIIAFLDDDVFVSELWLTGMLDCFTRTSADCVGGRTLVHWEGKPDPVLQSCEQQLVALDMGDREFEVRGAKLPGGGNAAFRREVFDKGYRFATDLGRVGTVLLSAEDTQLLLRLRRDGGRIWYCPAAAMGHRTGGERLQPRYVVKQKYWFGISYAVVDRKVYGMTKQWCLAFARLGKLLLVALPLWILARIRRDPRAELIARCTLAKQLGYLRATVSPITAAVTPITPATQPAAVSLGRV